MSRENPLKSLGLIIPAFIAALGFGEMANAQNAQRGESTAPRQPRGAPVSQAEMDAILRGVGVDPTAGGIDPNSAEGRRRARAQRESDAYCAKLRAEYRSGKRRVGEWGEMESFCKIN